jgi:hypothetical protein
MRTLLLAMTLLSAAGFANETEEAAAMAELESVIGAPILHARYGHMSEGAGLRNAFNYKQVVLILTDANVVVVTAPRRRFLLEIPYEEIRDVEVNYRGKRRAEVIVVATVGFYRFDTFVNLGGQELIDALRARTRN